MKLKLRERTRDSGSINPEDFVTPEEAEGLITEHAEDTDLHMVDGVAPSATKLATARTINGTAFNGTANIVTSNWGSARTITIGTSSKSVNGSANVTWTHEEMGVSPSGHTHDVATTSSAGFMSKEDKIKLNTIAPNANEFHLPAGTSGEVLVFNGTNWVSGVAPVPNIDASKITTGTLAAARIPILNQNTTGSAASLSTARTINGTAFNGTANITTSLWGTARDITIGSTTKSVNGSVDVVWTLAEIGAAAEGHSHPLASSSTDGLMSKEAWVKLNDIEEKANNFSLPAGTNGQVLKHNGTAWVPAADTNTTYSLMSEAELIAGTSTSARTISAQRLKLAVETHSGNIPLVTTEVAGLMSPDDKVKVNSLDSTYLGINANAASATKLATARTIGGVSFNGTANINLPGVNAPGNQNTTGSAASLTTARTINGTAFNGTANIVTSNWGTARNITIGSTAKSVNGSANVSWTLAEIGAASTDHNHDDIYEPAFTKNTAFNKNFGTAAGTVAQGNDSRINNGQTAFGWGNHASAGYVKTDTTYTAGNGLTLTGTTFSLPVSVTGTGTYVQSVTQTANGISVTLGTPPNTNTTYAEITEAEIDAGTATTLRTITGRRVGYLLGKKADVNHTHVIADITGLQGALDGKKAGDWTPAVGDIPDLPASKITSGTFAAARIPTLNQNTTGNAATATALQTARTINGTSFNGTANIVTSNWGTARTLTIGSTGKSVNGSANVSWTLAEIGAAPVSHTHTVANVSGLQADLDSKVSLTGDQSVSGVKTFTTALAVTGTGKAAGRFYAGTTDPTSTVRTNYDGKLHATGFNTGRFSIEYNSATESLDFNFV